MARREKSGKFFLNPVLIVVVVAVLLAAALIAASQLSARQKQLAQPGPAPAPATEQPTPTQPQEPVTPTVITAQPTKGSPDAPVTIVEFAEFYCPYCARYLWETYPKIERDYIDKGLVRYEFHNLIVHGPVALLAAVAGECAQAQGKFWPLHDRLFEAVFPGRSLSQSKQLGLAELERLAAEAGLEPGGFNRCLEGYSAAFDSCKAGYDRCTSGGGESERCAEEFNTCLEANAMFQKILEDQEELRRLIAQLPSEEQAQAQRIGTPTFFINGHILIGAQPYENFKAVIERELAKVKAGGS